jgi:hypothetical protein
VAPGAFASRDLSFAGATTVAMGVSRVVAPSVVEDQEFIARYALEIWPARVAVSVGCSGGKLGAWSATSHTVRAGLRGWSKEWTNQRHTALVFSFLSQRRLRRFLCDTNGPGTVSLKYLHRVW